MLLVVFKVYLVCTHIIYKLYIRFKTGYNLVVPKVNLCSTQSSYETNNHFTIVLKQCWNPERRDSKEHTHNTFSLKEINLEF